MQRHQSIRAFNEQGHSKIQKNLPINKDWRMHDLRHSFAYNYLLNGGEMYQLQAILGHKSIKMTVDLYGKLQAQDIKNPSPYKF
ncbi:MAG: tyrosine-type recombinase/integrase [Bdellovibrio sp.]|nr:tyrosine-type recombinase/integrase [Bdellovibrio sp.]